ncbi:SMP-30/gluconolactonase/LRE family protein [Nostoc sp. FACHB-110]|uniref:SMP-30/gluconolactonase/LRE family protein n=1 Tax=Nostoc sp. FACHB-110 TaxID=2692834 RepID=UPI001689E677|nr:SMP-30/gluconolactonase/LRE family protein [Nostoc sp. FACHB-110]MBD2435903.1 SMP-30/gluconolactonase/LRE family protein [Nostoc sp. FACHB-110]
MWKFSLLALNCVQILLLSACRYTSYHDTSAQAAIQITETPVAVNSSEVTLPPAYLISPIKVLQSDQYSEGIVLDSAGNLYFSQTKAGTITVITPEGLTKIWAKVPGANGHKIMRDRTHIVAAKNSIVKLDANGKLLKVIARDFNGQPLVYPNDITIDSPTGSFYFTDSGSSNPQTPNGAIYYVDSAGKINLVVSGLAFANGIVLSPNHQRLFVSESNKNQVLVYDILSPGKVGAQKVFAQLPTKEKEQIDNKPDGICLDAKGNLYVAHYGMGQVQVLNPEGKLIRRYATGNLTTSNCAFAGTKLDQLFVTGGINTEDGSGGIFRLDIGTLGLDIRPQ